ncbi:MAG: sigma-70 family RNA polymerase sigma factor [Deltaproteobacteria bacterium]
MEKGAERKLLARIKEGDDSAFEILVAEHSSRMLSLAWRLAGNREEAEDIAQEAFLRLHRSIVDFRGESSIATWLHRTVTRLAIDYLRRQKIRQRIFFFRRNSQEVDPLDFVPSSTPSPDERYFAGEIGRHLEIAMQRLSAQQRVVFSLRHFEEMPLREIADLLELEEGTVKSHLHRAVSILRKKLKDLQEAIS